VGRRSSLALSCAAIATLLASCASNSASPGRAAQHHAVTTTSRALARTGSTTSVPAATTTVPSSTTTSLPSGPGVLANCTAPPPQSLQVEPSSITVACADAGIGAKDLVWSSWTATTATAGGEVWENDCTPTCAGGTIKLYPASITLSSVQATRDGPAFTAMTATYSGAEPNGHPTDTFGLETPLG